MRTLFWVRRNTPRTPQKMLRTRVTTCSGEVATMESRSRFHPGAGYLRVVGRDSGPITSEVPHRAHGPPSNLLEPEALVKAHRGIVPDGHVQTESVIRQVGERVHGLDDERAPEALPSHVLPHPELGEERGAHPVRREGDARHALRIPGGPGGDGEVRPAVPLPDPRHVLPPLRLAPD